MSINIALLIMVVICFHFSIFEPLETALEKVSPLSIGCDLLSF